MTPEDAPRCDNCSRRYVARNTYHDRVRYGRVCDCASSPLARFVARPVDLAKLPHIDRVRFASTA